MGWFPSAGQPCRLLAPSFSFALTVSPINLKSEGNCQRLLRRGQKECVPVPKEVTDESLTELDNNGHNLSLSCIPRCHRFCPDKPFTEEAWIPR